MEDGIVDGEKRMTIEMIREVRMCPCECCEMDAVAMERKLLEQEKRDVEETGR